MPKVKICGITNLEDALQSVKAGCDALGFVFYKHSPRYITPRRARSIIQQLPRSVLKIGVFVNAREHTIRKTARLCSLDVLQFHGNESPQFCRRFRNFKIVKAFRVRDRLNKQDLLRYRPFAYLLDSFSASKAGGTGRGFAWKLIRHLDGLKQPIFLSGGLSIRNVRKAIRTVRPQWVDVSTSVEARPGKKDHAKVRLFIRKAKGSPTL